MTLIFTPELILNTSDDKYHYKLKSLYWGDCQEEFQGDVLHVHWLG